MIILNIIIWAGSIYN